MIRNVTPDDTKAITEIYNEYVLNSTISFETEALSENDMRQRISEISAHFPYLIYEHNGVIAGYCYAHPWKERDAYKYTLETTIYLHPHYQHMGIGFQLMAQLIEECRNHGYHALIACITGGNEASCALHTKLGFKQVSLFEKVGNKFGKQLDVVDYELLLV